MSLPPPPPSSFSVPGSNFQSSSFRLPGSTIPSINRALDQSIQSKIRSYIPPYRVALENRYDGSIRNVLSVTEWVELISSGKNMVILPKNRLKFIVEALTVEFPSLIPEILDALGFRLPHSDVQYNLLYYLCMSMSADRFSNQLTEAEIQYISELSESRLLQLLGSRYTGPQDRASLLFALVSGNSTYTPDLRTLPRYAEVSTYDPGLAWIIAVDVYGLIQNRPRAQNGYTYISPYPPYVYIATKEKSILELILVAVTPDNLELAWTQYQMISATPMNPSEQLSYFRREIGQYGPVFNRSADITPPPAIRNLSTTQVVPTLNQYTLLELVEAYEPTTDQWNGRQDLIQLIINESRLQSVWDWRHRHCNNDDTYNYTEYPVTLHGDMNKHNLENPTLSYGVQGNYRCYQAYELEHAFHEDNGEFHFLNPDYDPRQPRIDPVTGEPLARDFSTDSVRQLRHLLSRAPPGYNLGGLPAKVTHGLDSMSQAAVKMGKYKAQYQQFSREDQDLVRMFFAWLFLFTLWMRLWKGMTHELPLKRVTQEQKGYLDRRCYPSRRDENVFLYREIGTIIMDRMSPPVRAWLDTLDEFGYNFRTGGVTESKERLLPEIEILSMGLACMGGGADHLIQTVYYYLTKIFDLPTPQAVIDLVNQYLPVILDIERPLVAFKLGPSREMVARINAELDRLDAEGLEDEAYEYQLKTQVQIDKLEALEARAEELSQPVPVLPPFELTDIERNIHTD